MFSESAFKRHIFSNNVNFDVLALELFKFQYTHCLFYRQYTDTLGIDPLKVRLPSDIPFLPIQFFKSQDITCGSFEPELIFESSGTTQTVPSKHRVKEALWYEQSFLRGFELFYGPVSDYVILGLLPSYLERQNSSLVYMVDRLIRLSKHKESGFYLHDHKALHAQLQKLEETGQQTLLIGVTFGLLDFADQYPMTLQHTLVMETGGMKGRREEWTRNQVHDHLKAKLGVSQIHSEYGMTELLSQAYCLGNGMYCSPPWMKIDLREESDPLQLLPRPLGTSHMSTKGLINVTDLANLHSCAFIATDDIGILHSHDRFEVLGRMDHSALRGCSLMI